MHASPPSSRAGRRSATPLETGGRRTRRVYQWRNCDLTIRHSQVVGGGKTVIHTLIGIALHRGCGQCGGRTAKILPGPVIGGGAALMDRQEVLPDLEAPARAEPWGASSRRTAC